MGSTLSIERTPGLFPQCALVVVGEMVFGSWGRTGSVWSVPAMVHKELSTAIISRFDQEAGSQGYHWGASSVG